MALIVVAKTRETPVARPFMTLSAYLTMQATTSPPKACSAHKSMTVNVNPSKNELPVSGPDNPLPEKSLNVDPKITEKNASSMLRIQRLVGGLR